MTGERERVWTVRDRVVLYRDRQGRPVEEAQEGRSRSSRKGNFSERRVKSHCVGGGGWR